MQLGEWLRLSVQMTAESPVFSGLSQRRTAIRPLLLRSLQLQRFLVLRRALLFPVCLDAIQPYDNRRSCSLKLCTCLLKPVTRSLSAAFSRCIRPDIVRHSAKALSHSSSLFE
jgi:hypothetical protein